MLFEVGSIVEGKVTGITKFGAFVSFPGGKNGLVHISEVANTYVNDIKEFLADGQSVKVKVIGISEDGKINLSLKQAAAEAAAPKKTANNNSTVQKNRTIPNYADLTPKRSEDVSFEDKLKQFMQESGSKMSGSRLYEKPKRPQRRKKN